MSHILIVTVEDFGILPASKFLVAIRHAICPYPKVPVDGLRIGSIELGRAVQDGKLVSQSKMLLVVKFKVIVHDCLDARASGAMLHFAVRDAVDCETAR